MKMNNNQGKKTKYNKELNNSKEKPIIILNSLKEIKNIIKINKEMTVNIMKE